MDLTEKEKYQIFLEEKEKQKKREEEEKLRLLTEEDRQRIFNEFNEKKIVYVGKEDIVYPKLTLNFYGWAFGIGFFLFFVFINMIGAVFAFVIAFILFIILQMKGIILITPQIKYSCPKCNHTHTNILRPEEKQEMQTTGRIKAGCKGCHDEFQLHVEDIVLNEVTVK